MGFDYSSTQWRSVSERAKTRDGHRCLVSRFLGGRCSPVLHAHHLIPVSEGGAPFDLDNIVTCCSACHPQLEAMRRWIMRRRQPHTIRCRHNHRYDFARRECHARIARERGLTV